MRRWRLHCCLAAIAALVLTLSPAHAQAPAPRVTRTQVPVHEGTALRAALSPDGSKVAIILLGSVYLVDRSTGVATAVTDPATDPEMYLGVAWSPDATRLALQRGYWPPGLVIIEVATNRRTDLTTRQFASDDISWTAHTGVITLVQRGDSTDVVSYPQVEGGRASVLATLDRAARELAVSPGGTDLAYVTRTNVSSLPTAASQIATLDLGTRTTRLLGDAGGFDGFPAWSPDGQSIAFVSQRGGLARLWVMRRDGSDARMLSSPGDSVEYSPLSWTPDGKAVLFVSSGRLRAAPVEAGPSVDVPFTATLTVARWSGLRRPSVPRPGTRRKARGIVNPELSPDGRSVAFGALGDLWIAPATGGTPRRVSATPGRFEFRPRWSRDGTRLAYLGMDTGRDPVLRVRTLATGHDTAFVLPPLPGVISLLGHEVPSLVWSPDGRQIAIAGSNQIGIIHVETGAVQVTATQTSFISLLVGWAGTPAAVVFATGGARDSTLGVEPPFFTRVAAVAGGVGLVWTPAAPIEAENPAWTSDLSKAAFTMGGEGFWTDLMTRERTPIADPAPTHFSWSADGSRLGYLSGSRFRLLDVRSGRAVTADVAPTFTVKAAPPPVFIRNVRVIDGTGRSRTEPQDVLLQGGRIVRLGKAGTFRAGSGVQVIDGAGKTLMPGLVDMHAHMDGASSAGPSPGFLHYGVTAARDLGSPRERAIAMRERALLGETPSPRLFTSAGTLGSMWGHATTDNWARVASDSDTASIRRAVEAIRDGGADVLKFYDFNYRFQARVSAAAHAAGLSVTGHRTPLGAAYQGLEGHEHSTAAWGNEWTAPWREDLVAIAKAGNMCVTPTLALYVRRLQGPASPFPVDITDVTTSPFLPPFVLQGRDQEWGRPMSPARRMEWERDFRNDMASMLRLRRAGVRVVAGSDIALEGSSLHWELELLVMAGFTPLEALRAATLDAASCLGVEESLGSVEQGKIADLVLVSGDPSVRIKDAANVALVFLGGRPVSRAQLLDVVQRE